jgi:hypothetical protein
MTPLLRPVYWNDVVNGIKLRPMNRLVIVDSVRTYLRFGDLQPEVGVRICR